jgi:hypothetical protein
MKGSGSLPIFTDPDPAGPKTYGSYGSGTLVISIIYLTPQVENFDRMAS